MSVEQLLQLPDETATADFGARLASVLPEQAVIFLEGDLGAGKTTLVRALLRALGHQGAVRSPTYTLVEPYEIADRSLYHLDLYRLGSPEELEDIGIRDLLAQPCVLLIEWPERGAGVLPEPDLRLILTAAGAGRALTVRAATPLGGKLLKDAGVFS